MKRYFYLILTFTLLVYSDQLFSQIKVNSDGQVKIFGDRDGDDLGKDLSMQIYGKYGSFLANGRLGIGDYGRVIHNGSNVFIGELGTNWDSDRLQLHGKNGIYLTYSQGYEYNNIIGKWDIEQPDRFQFNVDVYAKGLKMNSDEKFKENIKPLDKKLAQLIKLKGICYKLKSDRVTISSEDFKGLTEKELDDFENMNRTGCDDDRSRLGFLAQDVQKLFPELVETDKDGYLYIDYVGLIPILVESIKEQQQQIDDLFKIAQKKGLLITEN